ncbi:dihydrolipoamide acetyltransferase family protein [Microbacterium saperdae]|uniref:Dihydrolipoamide acetyltransferase component of pyruvate dehydrogenase complex n=1 Tax=Microbacterium saperdae TaxID=69368 RepID=A0A543BLI5_9MICO|nr:dihydrolipoamide acetyltransferase family protein [Microbacterium saperdae]TQL85674.1 pyruvate dehydrogenase E2 component (dihydrolipoamide acetyltransferase) [Microbacterium saperdae]GGM53878.1 acetyltransferase component of pyruvate dehydrogenase complex [Microbacterium saperdae]
MIDILMPRLSDTMTEGAIAAWRKKPGDSVSPGDVLVEIETDKALMEQEAYDAGVLVEILVAEGENVAIGTPIARLDDGRDEVAPSPPAAAAAPAPTPAPAPAPAPADVAPARRAATPLVRRLARERGVDLRDVSGSGPGGRIVRADLEAVGASAVYVHSTASSATPSDDRDPLPVPFDAVRQAIASRLTTSATTVPSFTATASADVGELLSLRAQINDANAGAPTKISVNDLMVRATAIALRQHPEINASYAPEGRGQTLLHSRIHIGIAVASPAGLVVPVVRDADRAAVSTLAATTRELIAKAADRTLTTAEMSDGTFTISNLGMFGIEHFTAIINPPQGAILAVGGIRDELALIDGEVVERRRLRVTLTADHRIIDGAAAAGFLSTLVALLENPLRIVT